MGLQEANEKTISRKLLLWITIVIAVALVLVVLYLSYYLAFIYPENQVSKLGIINGSEKVNPINQYRATSIQFISTFAQIFGGIAVLIGIYFAWGNLTTAREGQITERFTRAIDQLGNKNLEIRLGGIYALERIANESEKDYWPIMEILTAYIRMNSSAEIVENKKNTNIYTDAQVNENTRKDVIRIRKLPFDIQAVLTVLGRRKYTYNNGESKKLNLSNMCLNGVEIAEAHFEGADLSNTHLEGANLQNANLTEANLDRAYMRDTNLRDANLRDANLRGAHLSRADLSGAYLQRADLVAVHLEGADLSGANLSGANLASANLSEADFSGAHLEGTHLGGANLEGAKFFQTHLQGDSNLTIDQLGNVRTLYGAELDTELEKQLREIYPALFKEYW